MSQKPETVFYTAVHKLLPKTVYHEKMHNPYRGGTPDVWYSGNKDDLWVEYKYIKAPPKKAEIHVRKQLSPLQLKWLDERYEEGRNVAVILGTPLGSLFFESRTWNSVAVTADYITKYGLTKRQVADWIASKTSIQ